MCESGGGSMCFVAQCHLPCFLTRVVVSSHFWHSIALWSLLHAHRTATQGVRVEYGDIPKCAVVTSMCVLYASVQAQFICTLCGLCSFCASTRTNMPSHSGVFRLVIQFMRTEQQQLRVPSDCPVWHGACSLQLQLVHSRPGVF